MSSIYNEIRHAIEVSHKSRYRLWQETGISEGQLCEFMGGTKGLFVASLEILADSLGLEITTKVKKKRKMSKSKKKGR